MLDPNCGQIFCRKWSVGRPDSAVQDHLMTYTYRPSSQFRTGIPVSDWSQFRTGSDLISEEIYEIVTGDNENRRLSVLMFAGKHQVCKAPRPGSKSPGYCLRLSEFLAYIFNLGPYLSHIPEHGFPGENEICVSRLPLHPYQNGN